MYESDKNWKLKLRYGRLTTPYKSYIVIAEGRIFDSNKSGTADTGNAFMEMSMWASSEDEATDMTAAVSLDVGFEIVGRIYVYTTEPKEPPRAKPYGYAINFTCYA